MTAILVAGLLLCVGAQLNGDKIQCKDGTWRDKAGAACKKHGGSGTARHRGRSPRSASGGKRLPKSESRATAICKDSTFWRGELDQHACEGNGGVKEPL